MLPDTCHEGRGLGTREENIVLNYFTGNDLSIFDIRIPDIDLVRYRNGT
jgi:hypothetical protein